MGVLPVGISVHTLVPSTYWKPEEGIRSSGSGVAGCLNCHVGAGIRTAASALNWSHPSSPQLL